MNWERGNEVLPSFGFSFSNKRIRESFNSCANNVKSPCTYLVSIGKQSSRCNGFVTFLQEIIRFFMKPFPWTKFYSIHILINTIYKLPFSVLYFFVFIFLSSYIIYNMEIVICRLSHVKFMILLNTSNRCNRLS